MQYDVNMVNMYLYIIYLYQRQDALGNIFKVNTDIKNIYAQKKCIPIWSKNTYLLKKWLEMNGSSIKELLVFLTSNNSIIRLFSQYKEILGL